MFARSLKKSASCVHGAMSGDSRAPSYRMSDYGYGKEGVRILVRTKKDAVHSVKEFVVYCHVKLGTHKEYYDADNSDIVGSDVHENLVYVLAKKHGLDGPEEFALLLTQYFLDTYAQVEEAHVGIEEAPWQRMGESEDEKHDHAFVLSPVFYRSCDVLRRRGEPNPTVMSGVRDLRILKTAQAPFVSYRPDAFRLQADLPHRILCANVIGQWEYSNIEGVDFAADWYKVKDLILKQFAGHPREGIPTSSVQFNAYQTEKRILDEMPNLCSVSLQFQNKLYVDYDFSALPVEKDNGVDVYVPNDRPHGIGYAQLDRI